MVSSFLYILEKLILCTVDEQPSPCSLHCCLWEPFLFLSLRYVFPLRICGGDFQFSEYPALFLSQGNKNPDFLPQPLSVQIPFSSLLVER